MLKKFLLIIFLITISYAFIYPHIKETKAKMHKIVANGCSTCHNINNIKKALNNPVRACDNFCGTCHDNMENHHKVGMELKQKLSPKVTLSKDTKVACFSCHNITKKRFDRVSWSAESLFSSLLSFKSKYKTYYLGMRNNKGQLCKECHY